MKRPDLTGPVTLAAAILIVATTACAHAQQPSSVAARPGTDGIDVLFIGNSYTYYNNLPRLVEAISESVDGAVVRASQHTHGGYSLRRHLGDGHIPDVLNAAASDGNRWERIVLQEHSRLGVAYTDSASGTLGDPTSFHAASRILVSLVEDLDAQSLFYMTWAKEEFPDQSAGLDRAYDEIGAELGVPVAPVGLAWKRVREERPDIDLFIADGSHPTPAGSYLSAAVIYAELTGYSPIGATTRISGLPWETPGRVAGDEPVALVDLDPSLAEYLQRVAWETVESHQLH